MDAPDAPAEEAVLKGPATSRAQRTVFTQLKSDGKKLKRMEGEEEEESLKMPLNMEKELKCDIESETTVEEKTVEENNSAYLQSFQSSANSSILEDESAVLQLSQSTANS